MPTTPRPWLLPLLLATGCAAEGPMMDGECADVFYADSDGDGYGDPGSTTTGCERPDGFADAGDDCDDADAAIHPQAAEICDGVDNDCDQQIDTADPDIDLSTQRAYFRDLDGDGYGDPSDSVEGCDKPAGYVADDTDCDDGEAAVNPGELEVCDGLDNDCDDLLDDADDSLDASTAELAFLDGDGDGFGAGSGELFCSTPAGYAAEDGDCDDGAADTHPGSVELCDGRDNDCDSGIDGTPAAPNQCAALAGAYGGSYSISAVEKVGNITVNQMHCTGSSSLDLDPAQSPALQGTVACSYGGGLVAFDSQQDGTIEADVDIDGNVEGTLVHEYESQLVRTYHFTGTLAGGELTITGTGSLLPHPMSAVPWEVDYSIAAD